MHASRKLQIADGNRLLFSFIRATDRSAREIVNVCFPYRPYSPHATLNKTCSQAGRERSGLAYVFGALSAAHQQVAAGGSGGRGCKTSNCRNLLQYEGRSVERRVLEEEQKLAAASAARCEDVICPGPVCSDEGAVPRDEYRGARGCNAAELHKGPRRTAQRRFWTLR